MKRFRLIITKLLYPTNWLYFILAPVAIIALIYIIATQRTDSMIAYPVCFISAYSLVIISVALIKYVGKLKTNINQNRIYRKVKSYKLGNKYLTDKAFRGNISIYTGVIANTLYMVFRFITGIHYESVKKNISNNKE